MKKIILIGITGSKYVFTLAFPAKKNDGDLSCHYCDGKLELKEPGIDHLLFACSDCRKGRANSS